jgi:acetylornithine deacetylase/succinyl-diaminopimelate desuccinylase-like protein
MPGIADNALVKAARLIERLDELHDTPRLGPETTAFLEAVLGEAPGADDALERARALHPLAAELIEPLLALTVSPTMIEASRKRNVVPGRCEVTVDCRLLPGQTQPEAEATVRAWIGEGDYDFELTQGVGGTRSPIDTPLWDAVSSFVEHTEPGAQAVPIVVAGFTDSHWLREAFGTVAYGFFPMRAMDPELAARLIHSADERVPVEDLELGVEFLRHAATAVCG